MYWRSRRRRRLGVGQKSWSEIASGFALLLVCIPSWSHSAIRKFPCYAAYSQKLHMSGKSGSTEARRTGVRSIYRNLSSIAYLPNVRRTAGGS